MYYEGMRIVSQNGYPAVNWPSHPLSISNGRVYIHRLVYYNHYGKIPDGYHVHHIDENVWNYNIENLQLLSSAEHSSIHKRGDVEFRECKTCNVKVEITKTRRKNYKNVFCSAECRDIFFKKDKYEWPSREKVLELVNKTNYTQAGKVLGVSDNAIRKFLKRTATT